MAERRLTVRTELRCSRPGPFLLALAAVVANAACSHPRERVVESAPRPLPAHPAPLPGGPGVPWRSKTRAQRLEYMGLVVFPEMRAVFRDLPRPAAAPFRCQTCHGEDMERADFKMPHALHPLPTADPMTAATAIDEKMARFMNERVVPAMRDLLARDDATEGPLIVCATCHPTAAPDEK